MKNNRLVLLLILLGIVVIAIIVLDYISRRPEKNAVNPYEYNVDKYKLLDDSLLIQYSEIKNIMLESAIMHSIDYHDNRIYILGDEFLQVISPEGKELLRKKIFDSPRSIEVSGDKIYIAYIHHISTYDLEGNLLASWDTLGTKTVLTSLAVKNDLLFAADAGNRRVLRYKISGEFLGYFEGKADTGQLHGFIIPSANFDLAINDFDELWVVNPGKHALEHYSFDGRLLGFWESSSFEIEGFSGCCNPARIDVLPDGSFVTSEKGLVRIKIHKASGELSGVVAPNEKFKDAFNAPDLAVSPEGLIYALDFDSHMIRVFQHK